MKTIFKLLFCSLFFINCNGQDSKNIETIAAKNFSENIKNTPNAQLIDVRTPEEFASQKIENAKNINWNDEKFVENTKILDKTKPVFMYCTSGGRSKLASDKLIELGFQKVYNLQGGILKWNAAGLAPKSDKIIGMCSQEYNELLNSDKKILVNFYAEWCAPCKKMAPYLLQMQKNMSDTITIIRLNADENKTLISELKIDELPVLILYENKKIKWQHAGYISEEDLKTQL